MKIDIVPMEPGDWEAVRTIYLQGLATGNATLETEAPEYPEWDKSHLRECRLVARCGGQVIGWAALCPVSSRCVYSGVTEESIYVHGAWRGRGLGRALLEALVAESERAGFWTIQAGILPENEASIALHKACGFREVGRRERLGRMNGVWRDVVLMERRSNVAGT